MKKFLAFIVAIIYLTVSTGFIVNVHYCMGKVSSVKLEKPAKQCCCKKKHKNCCKTEQKIVKLNSNTKFSDVLNESKIAFVHDDIIKHIIYFNSCKPIVQQPLNLTYNLPPPYKAIRFALLHYCVLRI